MTLQADDLLGNNEWWIKALPNDSISSYGYSRNMNRFLQKSDYDLYHTNGMWMYCNHETCLVARKKTNHMSLRLMECFIRKHWPGLRGRKNYFSQWGELLKI